MNHKPSGPQPSGCFRALSAVERGSGLKAPKGLGPKRQFMGSCLGPITMHSAIEPVDGRAALLRRRID